jgi:SnoaL-like polyketide cyclase.
VTPDENAEVVRRALDDWNRRDWRAWVTEHHGNMVAVPPRDWPETDPLDGLEAWLRYVQQLLEPWDEQRLEIDSIETVGEVIITCLRWVARGRASEIEVDIPLVANYLITDGRIKHIDFFFDGSEAREAAGLTTRPPSQAEVEQGRKRAEQLWRSFETELQAADAERGGTV